MKDFLGEDKKKEDDGTPEVLTTTPAPSETQETTATTGPPRREAESILKDPEEFGKMVDTDLWNKLIRIERTFNENEMVINKLREGKHIDDGLYMVALAAAKTKMDASVCELFDTDFDDTLESLDRFQEAVERLTRPSEYGDEEEEEEEFDEDEEEEEEDSTPSPPPKRRPVIKDAEFIKSDGGEGE